MKKEELINEINAFGIEGVNLPKETETKVEELKLMHKIGKKMSDENKDLTLLVEQLNDANSKLSETVARLKKGDKSAALPEVEYKGKAYVFYSPKFQLPRQAATTAEEVAERNDEKEIAECIKFGALVPKKGGKDA